MRINNNNWKSLIGILKTVTKCTKMINIKQNCRYDIVKLETLCLQKKKALTHSKIKSLTNYYRRLTSWSFGKCRVLLHCHRSQVHFVPEPCLIMWCQWSSSPARRWPGRSGEPYGFNSVFVETVLDSVPTCEPLDCWKTLSIRRAKVITHYRGFVSRKFVHIKYQW